MASIAAVVALIALGVSGAAAAGAVGHPATGVGSCTLKGWNPSTDPHDAKALPVGHRPQTYEPDNYNCTGVLSTTPLQPDATVVAQSPR